MAKHKCTVAKDTQEEFDRVWGFVHPMEALFDGRGFFSNEEDWRDWDDDDEDKKLLLKIEKDLLAAGEDEYDGQVDNRLILYEFMKVKFLKANYSGSIGRILFDCSTLIDNCCDPDLDYLEFKPSIMHAERIAIEKVEKIIINGEEKGLSADDILADIKKHIEEIKKQDEEE